MGVIFGKLNKRHSLLQEYTRLQARQDKTAIGEVIEGVEHEENECCVCMESDYLMATPLCCQSRSEKPDKICSKCLAGGLKRKHIHRPDSHDYMTWECPLCRTVNEEKVFQKTREYSARTLVHIKEMRPTRNPPSRRTKRKHTVNWPYLFNPKVYKWNCIDCKQTLENPAIIGHFSSSVMVSFCKNCVEKKARRLGM